MRIKNFIQSAAVIFALPAFAMSDLGVTLPHRPSDGYGDVRSANLMGAEKRLEEGKAFLSKLRSIPAEKRNLEERQSVDMAEYALLRHDLGSNKARCIECLKSVYDSGSTSFWGWAAYTFLKEFGENVPEPPKDPLRGLGAFGEGVVNLEPKVLEKGVCDEAKITSAMGRIIAATNEVQASR